MAENETLEKAKYTLKSTLTGALVTPLAVACPSMFIFCGAGHLQVFPILPIVLAGSSIAGGVMGTVMGLEDYKMEQNRKIVENESTISKIKKIS